MKIGIIGCGFVGGALKKWMEEHNPSVIVRVSDPAKGFHDNMSDIDVAFISIHIPTEECGSQDLSTLIEIIENLPNKPIFIRSTLLPGTSRILSEKTGKQVYFMPEFLTERTAYADFCEQPMVFSAEEELLSKIFVGKKYLVMTSLEAEITKYAHNVFGAVKVTYFNGIFNMCQTMGTDFERIRQGVLLSGYINDTHTQVPGPDGKLGYGGKCFPKDVNAFTEYCKDFPIYNMLKEMKPLNLIFRKEDK